MIKITKDHILTDASSALSDAKVEPVFIFECDEPAFVLMSIAHHQALIGGSSNIVDLLDMPGIEEVECDFPPGRS